MTIPKEIVQQARQADLVDYLKSKGVALKHVGHGEYQHPDHDSLYISGNHYNQFSTAKGKDGRNAITFLMEFYDMSFAQAVEELTGYKRTQDTDTNYQPSKTVPDARRVIAYLAKKRGINYELIRPLISSGKIKQDERGNAVFCVFDFEGKHICDFLRGTTDKDFKGIRGEQCNFGFTVQYGLPKNLIFFEAPIDLLSFIQLRITNLDDTLLIAMGGLKPNIFRNYFNHYPDSKFQFAVDNDKSADNFINSLYDEETAQRMNGIYSSAPFKDWNEKLLAGLKKTD